MKRALFLVLLLSLFSGCDLKVVQPPASERYSLHDVRGMVLLLDNQNGKVWRNVACKDKAPPNCWQITTFVDVAPKKVEIEQKGEWEAVNENIQQAAPAGAAAD